MWYKVFALDLTSRLEQLLCDHNANVTDILKLYRNDLDKDSLTTQLQILHRNLPKEVEKKKGGAKPKSIISYLQSLALLNVSFIVQYWLLLS